MLYAFRHTKALWVWPTGSVFVSLIYAINMVLISRCCNKVCLLIFMVFGLVLTKAYITLTGLVAYRPHAIPSRSLGTTI